ncbi:tRNA (adenosine(37)-N6)-threonylcarbamoyltransferase complex dimerization subunit type 1 TsaB [Gammaproteobacteria bacterium AB-CW1]|uniref:tRNA threonylcarbamoyladenosine biosynthesis protein TsaB n=1 Tax=Natronospira elongata TaxID=3110268 RepID=A0AAP6MJM5_9GAMM|nr:tRNA (adenosine(37)-N6)-threonylcarbamoyltransferase complex dimerization subunit type 1 TsaB [Gammaproteobacteria bacterium AB-CW1]
MSRLAIDTATEACSAALEHGGRVYHRYEVAPRRHADLMLPMIESLLAEAGCDRREIEWIAFGRGPGAFTGVRIAAGIAHGLSLGVGCGLVPVSNLEALAVAAATERGEAQVLTAIDARMGEVYWAGFGVDGDQLKVIAPEQVCPPSAVRAGDIAVKQALAVGTGWGTHGDALIETLGVSPATIIPDALPDAAVMLRIAMTRVAQGTRPQAPSAAQPVYLRDKVAVPGGGTNPS